MPERIGKRGHAKSKEFCKLPGKMRLWTMFVANGCGGFAWTACDVFFTVRGVVGRSMGGSASYHWLYCRFQLACYPSDTGGTSGADIILSATISPEETRSWGRRWMSRCECTCVLNRGGLKCLQAHCRRTSFEATTTPAYCWNHPTLNGLVMLKDVSPNGQVSFVAGFVTWKKICGTRKGNRELTSEWSASFIQNGSVINVQEHLPQDLGNARSLIIGLQPNEKYKHKNDRIGRKLGTSGLDEPWPNHVFDWMCAASCHLPPLAWYGSAIENDRIPGCI